MIHAIYFFLFLNKITVFLAHKLAKTFRDVIAVGNFLLLWRTANITHIPKKALLLSSH